MKSSSERLQLAEELAIAITCAKITKGSKRVSKALAAWNMGGSKYIKLKHDGKG